jgi:hypothetical protein
LYESEEGIDHALTGLTEKFKSRKTISPQTIKAIFFRKNEMAKAIYQSAKAKVMKGSSF